MIELEPTTTYAWTWSDHERLPALAPAALAPALSLTACDNIFGIDDYAAPNARLTSRVVSKHDGREDGGVSEMLFSQVDKVGI